ncbi:MAG: tRNA pseudouridine(55) synthase TruB [Deltaproteobacteria bacterium]|nr:tRNA pseudouridine(55) synthase TruB [Deltaproteobacteria bacterium]
MPHQSNGIILIDKPAGISSAKVVAIVKKALKVRKAGHTGTLDPFATGLLICCLNNATKIADFLIKDKKGYEAVLHLGIETDTEDITGKIIATCDKIDFSDKEINSVFKNFKGKIEQIPPAYSALKHKGVPLYKLARQGTPVKKPARTIIISDISILNINLPEIHFKVWCSAGTYIRTLASDIGKKLGCGGHLKSLRRMQIGRFSVNDSIKLDKIEKLSLTKQNDDILLDKIISMTDALPDIPAFFADEMQTKRIKNGCILTGHDFHYDDNAFGNGNAKILDNQNNIIAIVKYNNKDNIYKYNAVFN